MKSSLVLKYFFPLAIIALAIWFALGSTGFLEPDEISHFLKAQSFASGDWKQLLDIWGRPACTGLYGLGALIAGFTGARLLAVLIFALTCSGATALFRQVQPANSTSTIFGGGYIFWIWMLMLAQPMVLLNSFTVMTEMLLACAWVWAAVMLAKRKWIWASVLVGFGGLARPEGLLAAAIWGIVVWIASESSGRAARILIAWALAFLPALAWWAAGAIAYHDASWMLHQFPWHIVSQYGKTGAVFVESALVALGVWMWAPLGVGMWSLRKQGRWLLILALPVVGFFGVHAIAAVGGWMGSMSLPRYFICVSPFIAVLCLRGLERIQSWVGRDWWGRLVRRGVLLACVLPLVVGLIFQQLPVPKSMNLEELDWTIRGFKLHCENANIPPADYQKYLIAAHPYIFYRLGLSLDSPINSRAHSADAIEHAPLGTMVITDAITWNWEGGPTPEDLTRWGYLPDGWVALQIARVKPRWDLSMIASKNNGVTALWVKEK